MSIISSAALVRSALVVSRRRLKGTIRRIRASLHIGASNSPTGSCSGGPTLAQRGGRPSHVSSSHGQPFSCTHCSTSRWPPLAADEHVYVFHGQPFSRAHFNTSRWPPFAASAHVLAFHGQPFARAHCSTSRWPCFAAYSHVLASHGHPSARNAFTPSRSPFLAAAAHRRRSSRRRPRRRRHLSVLRYPRLAASRSPKLSTFRPVASTASRMPLLTARRFARSAVSGRLSGPRNSFLMTSYGRSRKFTWRVTG